jgi:hypothetical protein
LFARHITESGCRKGPQSSVSKQPSVSTDSPRGQ